MTSLPTFERWGKSLRADLGSFKYKESLVLRGAVWTMASWLPMTVYCLLPSELYKELERNSAAYALWDIQLTAAFILVFPGAPLLALAAALGLSGGASGLLDSLKRGLKTGAALFIALLVVAAVMAGEGGESGLVAAIVFWVAVLSIFCGAIGGVAMYYYGKNARAQSPAPAGVLAAAGPVFSQAEREWLEAAAGALRGEGLLDYATASAFHRRLLDSGQAPAGTGLPLEKKYRAACAAARLKFPARTEEDWRVANSELRRAALIAAKAGPGSRAALEAAYPGFSAEFYAWAEECARRLP